jgi:hypothetical protein
MHDERGAAVVVSCAISERGSRRESHPNALNGSFQVTKHQVAFEPKHTVPHADQLGVAARVCCAHSVSFHVSTPFAQCESE